jgi:hypothetical protein
MSMFIVSSKETIHLLQSGVLEGIHEFRPVLGVYKRQLKASCRKCRKKRVNSASLSGIMGACINNAVKKGQSEALYNSISRLYSIKGPVKFIIGTCNLILEDKNG